MLKKQLDEKYKVNFKIHNVTTWLTNDCSIHIHIAQYPRSKNNHTMKLDQLIVYIKIFFFKTNTESKVGRLVLDPFLFFKKA